MTGSLSKATVEAVLIGGPADLQGIRRIDESVIAEGKLKVPYGSGYEHFVCGDEVGPAPAKPVEFRWTTRTRIAE